MKTSATNCKPSLPVVSALHLPGTCGTVSLLYPGTLGRVPPYPGNYLVGTCGYPGVPSQLVAVADTIWYGRL